MTTAQGVGAQPPISAPLSARLACYALAALLTACALPGGGRPSAVSAASSIDVDAAVAALQRADIAYDEGRYEAASEQADSLFAAWREQSSLQALADRAQWTSGRALEAQGLPGAAADRYDGLVRRAGAGRLRDEAVERLASVLADTGREPEAVAIVLENPGVLDRPSLDAFRQWVSTLSMDRVRGFSASYAPDTVEATVVHVQLAQLLIALREEDEARRVAAAVLAGRPAPPERDVAELIASVDGDVRRAVVKIGALLPLTGDLANIGELLREGIELAVDAYGRARPDGFRLELTILDDQSDPEKAAELVEQLEREDVVAIVGPLRSESFASAVRARRNPRLLIISPTATEVLRPSPGAYTLYDVASREMDIAVDLARWTVGELGLRRVAVLEPTGAGLGSAVAAFISTIREVGGEVVAHERYDPSLTTFREPIEAIAAVEPDVVFAPAPTTQVVLSVAPQLFYYGLHDAIVLGNETWGDPAALRRLEDFAADHRIIGVSADRVSPRTRWQQFVADYEKTYRKSLRDNVLPALAYDAVALVIAALEGGGLPIPAVLAAYLDAGPEIEAVTGRFRPEPGHSTVRRTTLVRMLSRGGLVPADPSELLSWLAEVRAAPSPFAPRDPVPR